MLNPVPQPFAISASGSSISRGTAIFSNSNGVTFGLSGSTITASVAPSGAGLSAGTQSVNTGTVNFANSNGVSFGMSGSNQITVSYTVPAATVFSNSNNVSFGLNGSTITASATVASTQDNVNISAGTTSTNLSNFVFSNSGGVSFGLNGSTITATVATNYQSQGAYLTTADLSQNSSKYAGTNGAITGGSITVNTSGVSVNLPAYLTTAMQSNAATISNINVSASNTSNNLSNLVFSNSNGISFGLNGSTITASGGGGLSAINVSAGTTSSNVSAVTFSNAHGISFGYDGTNVSASYTVPAQFTGGFSTQGNTLGNTGLVTGQMLLVGTNNITLSGSTNGGSITISISGGAGAAGNTGYISANATASLGTIVFSNSNGVSFGINGQTLTGSIATSLTNINVSAGTTSGNLSAVTFSNSNGISFGLSASTITASVATSLTNINISAGATSGNLSAVTFSNSNGVSFGLSASTVTASVAAQTNQSGNVYASSNTFGTSSGTYDARSLSIAGSGIVSVAASNSGWVINASTAAQTNQSGNVYASSNTFGTSSGTYDARSLSIAGSGACSVAASNSGWVISVPTNFLTTADLSQNSSKYIQAWELDGNNTAGTTSSLQGTKLYLSAGNSLTLSGNSNTIVLSVGAYLTTAMQSNAATISNVNLSAGTTSNNLSAFVFSNSNNVSFGLNGSTVTATASYASQTNQSGNVYASSNTFGTSSGTYDARSLSIAGSGACSVAASNSGWVVSVPTNFLTTAMQSNAATISNINVSAGTTSNNLSAFVLSNSNNVSFGLNGSTVTATATFAQSNQSAIRGLGASNTGNTAGNTGISTGIDWVLAGTQNITISESTTAGGPNTLWVSGPANQSNQSGNVYASSNTFGTSSGTYDARSISIAGSGIVSVAASNSGWVINATTAAQTNQSGNIYASSNTFGTSSGTYDARSISIAGSGAVSVAASNSGWVISAPAQVSYSQSLAMGTSTAGGGTGGTTGTVSGNQVQYYFYAGSNVTLSQSVNASSGSLSIYGGAGGGGQTNQTGNFYALSNTTGTSSGTYDARTVSIAGAGAISVAASNSGFVVSSPVTSSLSATGWVQISSNGSTISIGATSGPVSYYQNMPYMANTQTMSVQGSTSYIQPFALPNGISASYIRMPITMSAISTSAIFTTTANFSASLLSTIYAVVYSLGTGASSNSLQSVASGSAGFSQQWSISVSGVGTDYSVTQNVTYPITGGTSNLSTSYASTFASVNINTANLSNFNGLVYLDIPFANSIYPGVYWLGYGISSTVSTNVSSFLANAMLTFSNWAVSQVNTAIGHMGAGTNSSVEFAVGLGSFSTNAIGTTASLDLSNISSSASNPVIPFQMIRRN